MLDNIKINSTRKAVSNEEWRIVFKYENKKWEVMIRSRNGVVYGGPDDNVSTDNMDYFSYSNEVRQAHFELFKKSISQKQK